MGPTKAIHQSYAHWYNRGAFAVPCQATVSSTGASSTPAYRYGDASRRLLRGPQTVNFDLSAARNIPIKERFNLTVRMDAFDALNHPPMGFPNQTINVNAPSQTSTAITTTYADNRDLQASLKLSF